MRSNQVTRSHAENGWNYWWVREGPSSCLVSGSIHVTNVKGNIFVRKKKKY